MYENKVSPNVLSLTDTALTLIVVFLVTLPSMFWNGINIDAIKPPPIGASAPDAGESILLVGVSKKLLYVNGRATAFSRLKKILHSELAGRSQREIVVAPDGDVTLKRLVKVFDACRAAGAKNLILIETPPPQ
ncbi:biopolymer transporter ExbD [bacterium]|nr:biopolymer transporter ExbD [bacterium]